MLTRAVEAISRILGTGPDTDVTMRHVVTTIERLKADNADAIAALETGTIRSYHEKHESTRLIGEALGGRGTLTSVDNSAESIRISKDICRRLTNVVWVEADSHHYLASLEGRALSFVLLDSMNDKSFIMTEFRLVVPRVVDGGVIMIDDAGILADGSSLDPSTPAEKGHAIFAFLRQHRYPFEVLGTRHSVQLRLEVQPRLRDLLATH
jgi:predicted O-methyltransferase YrrM